MCQYIVGTEEHVKEMRMMNTIRDNLSSNDNTLIITSGSFGEGIEMRGSDLDIMIIWTPMEVCENKNNNFNPDTVYFAMETNDTQPGFTQLRLLHSKNRDINRFCVKRGHDLYLSSTAIKQHMSTFPSFSTVHGPCVTDKNGYLDIAVCLRSKSWVTTAMQWIERSNNTWPKNDVKASVVQHGILFVPIGIKGSSSEDFEWRLSFSVGEKLLISSFTHSQLICYSLIKILLKDVIAIDCECKDLLCSYFMKTIVFWISEEISPTKWRPENLLSNFMSCFRRLVYCVENSVCPHYFIPENNVFENKITGHARTMLLNKLYILKSYGWRCILLSNQFLDFHLLVSDTLKDSNSTAIDSFNKLLFSKMLRNVNGTIHRNTATLEYTIHLLLCIRSSKIKYIYLYYMSKCCCSKAQTMSLRSISGNKPTYIQYKVSMSTLLLNMHHDAVSGWLLLASFFYGNKQYNSAICTLQYSLSKCSPEKVYEPFMKLSEIHHEFVELNLLKNMNLVRLWKILMVKNFNFHTNSTLIPDELKILEHDTDICSFSPVEYIHFLSTLCINHLTNTSRCTDYKGVAILHRGEIYHIR
ncbi:uncharacterized protein LOC143042761 [Mytilus galloprovincialis]|uniref:uncharacterized protein LOC143042761 n=1 Tax=Mytilus galloprovincialis TaxID=29158 RepID=UPI003F7B597E